MDGTLGEVIAGTATAAIDVKVTGLGIQISVASLLGALAQPIVAALFDPDLGVIAAVAGDNSPLALLVGAIVESLAPAFELLNTVISLTGNVQEEPEVGVYREVALRASLLRLVPGSVGVIDLGTAEVGPNDVLDAVVPTVTGIDPAEGPLAGGNEVEITGSDFTEDSVVTVDGVEVPAEDVTVNDEGSITVIMPAGTDPGAVDVTVTTAGGESDPLEYTYLDEEPAAPTVTGIDPAEGPLAGGNEVEITGSDFTDDSVVTVDGVEVPAEDVTVNDEGSITVVMPAGADPGAVDVTVTTPGGESDPLEYTYLDEEPAAPTVTGIDPSEGPLAGGNEVEITGTDFAEDSVVIVDGVEVPAEDVTVNDEGSITVVMPAGTDPGAVDVTVTTAGGESDPLEYTYLDDTEEPAAPSVTGIDPAEGPLAGGNEVEITGSDFTEDSVVTVDGVEVPAEDVTVNDEGSITVVMPAGTDPGAVDVTVTTPGGESDPLEYTYLDEEPAAPTVTGIDPSEGPLAGGNEVEITGTDFAEDSVVIVDGVEVPAEDVTVNDEGSITVVMPAGTDPGAVDVTVTTAGGESDPLEYTYLDDTEEPAAPSVTGIDPAEGPLAGGNEVEITGSDFTEDSVVTVDGVEVPAEDVTVNDEGSITVVMPAGTDPGAVDVTVTTPGGESDPLEYTYLDEEPAAPTVTGIDPSEGPLAGGNEVEITGTDFAEDSVVIVDGVEVPAEDVTVNDEGSITVVMPAGTDPGAVDVTVTTAGGESDPLEYTYLDDTEEPAAPSVTGIDPSEGPLAGGNEVEITGSDFTEDSVVTVDGVDVPAEDVTVNDEGSITVVMPAGTDPGAVDVTVTTAGGESDPLEYTYLDEEPAAPTVTGIDPAEGPLAGGNEVEITGTDFAEDSVVIVDGVEVPAEDVTVNDDTSITVVMPAGTDPGAVDVTVTTAGGESDPLEYTYLDEEPAAPTVTGIDPSEGPLAGGNEVEITGTDFAEDSVVIVDGVEVPAEDVTVNDEGSITVVMPAGTDPGAVDVTVTTAGGESDPLEYTYLDEEPAAPTVTGIDPAEGPLAGGNEVEITGTDFAEDSVVIVDGVEVPAEDVTVNDEGSITVVMPAGTDPGAVDVTVTTAGGESDPLEYTYLDEEPAAPTVTGIDPAEGPLAGGNEVEITGTDFAEDSVVIVDGVEVPAEDVTVNDEGSITVVMPAGTDPGAVDVTVTTAGGESDPLEYTYLDEEPAAPTVTGIDPSEGPLAGGNEVEITGTDFAEDSVVIVDGVEVPAEDVTVNDEGSITVIMPAGTDPGAVDVTVTTAGGESDPLEYTYLDEEPAAPTVTGIDPAEGPLAGGNEVEITGTDFAEDSVVTVDGVEVPAEDVTVNDEGSITVVMPAGTDPGAVDVTVTTAGGESDPLEYTYLDEEPAAPTVTGIDPSEGPLAGGNEVEITGTDFTDDSVVTVDGVEVPADDVTVNDDTSITVVMPAGTDPGAVDVTVTTPGGESDPLEYTYLDDTEEPAAPSVTGIDPAEGPLAGGNEVEITGSDFTDDSVVTVDGVEVPVEDVTVNDEGSITVVMPAGADPGAVDVTVTTPGGESAPVEYTYLDDTEEPAAPTVTGIDPAEGPLAGGNEVEITGTDFTEDSVVTVDGVEVPTDDVVVTDATAIAFMMIAGSVVGPVDVTVTTAGGESDPIEYTYLDDDEESSPPVVTDIDPGEGPIGGGNDVDLSGSGFTDDTVVTVDGTDVPAENVVVNSDTSITVTMPPGTEAGTVEITVTTAAGTSDPIEYEYLASDDSGSDDGAGANEDTSGDDAGGALPSTGGTFGSWIPVGVLLLLLGTTLLAVRGGREREGQES